LVCLPVALAACGGDGDGTSAALVLDHLTTREAAYHSSIGALPGVDAIRTETSDYTGDMHGLLDAMSVECREMRHSGPGMETHTMDDMAGAMDRMQGLIDENHSRMEAMADVDSMRVECGTHHQAMEDLLGEMDGMIPGGGMMGGGRGMM
jgi:hypothetical protein